MIIALANINRKDDIDKISSISRHSHKEGEKWENMISNIKIENFKSLKSVDVSGLKGLNIFWGKNNSGKSAIMQAILLLKQSIKYNEIVYDGDLIKLSSFETVAFGLDADNNIKINIEFKLNSSDTCSIRGILSDFFGNESPNLNEIDLQSICYRIEFGKRCLIETVFDSRENTLCEFEHFRDGKYNRQSYFPLLVDPLRPYLFTGDGILNWSPSASGIPTTSNLANALKKILIREFDNIYFISNERGISDRTHRLLEKKELTAGVGIKGEKTISIIQHLRNNDMLLFKEITDRTNDFGIKLTTKIDGSKTSLIYSDGILPIDVNVVDAGFGLNQILPIIVQSYIAGEGSTILIEEPETHLHEGAQYKLLDMFLDIIGKGKQAIITSHSVALRSRIKREYENGVLSPEQVQFYRIELGAEGSIIRQEPLNDMDISEGRQYMSQEDYVARPSE